MKRNILTNINKEALHKLLTITPILQYQLNQAENTRKEIAKISLKVKRVTKK